jgi:hypothetical protein
METKITMSLKEYEDLKQFKDNFHKKNFVSSQGTRETDFNFYTETYFNFYTDEEMHKELMNAYNILQTEHQSLRKENAFFKNSIENSYSKFKKMNIFQFLKWKRNN